MDYITLFKEKFIESSEQYPQNDIGIKSQRCCFISFKILLDFWWSGGNIHSLRTHSTLVYQVFVVYVASARCHKIYLRLNANKVTPMLLC